MRADLVDRFARDGTLVLGGGRAILLQVADPAIGSAVDKYSDFAHQPLKRLGNTLTFVYGTLLGTPRQAALVAHLTRRAHDRVPGANDPDHQLWVAATLYQTAVQVHERLHGPLAAEEAQAVLTAYAPLGTALEVPLERWPATPEQFDLYWAKGLSGLEVGSAARQVAHDLFHPVTVPLSARAALPLVALLTADLLDEQLRDAYGMPWSPHRARRAAAAWAVIRALARILPAHVLAWPSRHYLKRLALPNVS